MVHGETACGVAMIHSAICRVFRSTCHDKSKSKIHDTPGATPNCGVWTSSFHRPTSSDTMMRSSCRRSSMVARGTSMSCSCHKAVPHFNCTSTHDGSVLIAWPLQLPRSDAPMNSQSEITKAASLRGAPRSARLNSRAKEDTYTLGMEVLRCGLATLWLGEPKGRPRRQTSNEFCQLGSVS